MVVLTSSDEGQLDSEVRALRDEIVDIKVRQADMNKKLQRDMSTVKKLLYRMASQQQQHDDVTPTQHGECCCISVILMCFMLYNNKLQDGIDLCA